MIHLLNAALYWGFCCAVIGVAVVSVFGQDDLPPPFRQYFAWASRWQERGGWRSWITSPIGGCVLCTSGQLAMWSFSLVRPWGWAFDWAWGDPPTLDVDFTATFLHLLAGCSGVLCAFAVNKAYQWLNNKI